MSLLTIVLYTIVVATFSGLVGLVTGFIFGVWGEVKYGGGKGSSRP